MNTVNPKRIRTHTQGDFSGSCVVYLMSRDMRLEHNWAFLRAQEIANKSNVPLLVVYHLVPNLLGGGMRQWDFKVRILEEIQKQCHEYGIGFILSHEDFKKDISSYVHTYDVGYVVTDFCPLRYAQEWVSHIKKTISVPFEEVDAHNIVPCFVASTKQEFGAYTLRPKIQKLLKEFLVPFPKIHVHTAWTKHLPSITWSSVRNNAHINQLPHVVSSVSPSADGARKVLKVFIEEKLKRYHLDRNDPNIDGQSNLSPYLHYGVISAQHIALSVDRAEAPRLAKEAFLDELIVRRELSDNFCFYNPHYDSTQGFPEWAKKSLDHTRKDTREYVYNKGQFEKARTHDALWNACQIQMVVTGKMHGYMRMYWAKKILEWTKTPEDAMRIAIYLNDMYELDGRDPNGYAGIAWSIGGVHDRAWFKRPVYGQIRYMNASGASKKFDTKAYIEKWSHISL